MKVCPVCNSSLNSFFEFCPKCNWELIVISEDSSLGLKNYYSEKMRLHKKSIIEIRDQDKNYNSKIQEIEVLKKQKKEFELKIDSLRVEIKKYQDEIQKKEELDKEILKKGKIIETLKKDLEIQTNKYKSLEKEYKMYQNNNKWHTP